MSINSERQVQKKFTQAIQEIRDTKSPPVYLTFKSISSHTTTPKFDHPSVNIEFMKNGTLRFQIFPMEEPTQRNIILHKYFSLISYNIYLTQLQSSCLFGMDISIQFYMNQNFIRQKDNTKKDLEYILSGESSLI